jgi:thymidylate synthase ThyX
LIASEEQAKTMVAQEREPVIATPAADGAGVERRVFSVLGMRPEPGGYAVAKFSRSARPYEEWAAELTQSGAERFYEQFYFQYGHASIADLAHLTMVVENVSIVAAIELLDEPLVDAQESSTRYQDYSKRRYFTPPEICGTPLEPEYRGACDALFAAYEATHRAVTARFMDAYAGERPADVSDAEYRRTVRARAFDVARYLLPTSTYTGLGYLLSARTLERQIVRLLSDTRAEVRAIGAELKAAVTERPAFNPQAGRLSDLLADLERQQGEGPAGELAALLRESALSDAPVAPTLVKYTAPSPYRQRTYGELAEAVGTLVPARTPETARGVTLAPVHDQERELAATLVYRVTPYSYRQALEAVDDLSAAQRAELIELAHRHRGPHDPPLRETRTGHQLIFDVCVDCGGFRDLHRHRNCVQIVQPFSGQHGYDTPAALVEAGLDADYTAAMERAGAVARALAAHGPDLAGYALPLGYRRRTLFKMDAAELAYIAEVRTRPAGHFSYRDIAYQMYAAFAGAYPTLARHVRVSDPTEERFFER